MRAVSRACPTHHHHKSARHGAHREADARAVRSEPLAFRCHAYRTVGEKGLRQSDRLGWHEQYLDDRYRHKAIADYLRTAGFSQTCQSFLQEAAVELDATTDSLLEKKWTSVVRLQKKVATDTMGSSRIAVGMDCWAPRFAE